MCRDFQILDTCVAARKANDHLDLFRLQMVHFLIRISGREEEEDKGKNKKSIVALSFQKG